MMLRTFDIHRDPRPEGSTLHSLRLHRLNTDCHGTGRLGRDAAKGMMRLAWGDLDAATSKT